MFCSERQRVNNRLVTTISSCLPLHPGHAIHVDVNTPPISLKNRSRLRRRTNHRPHACSDIRLRRTVCLPGSDGRRNRSSSCRDRCRPQPHERGNRRRHRYRRHNGPRNRRRANVREPRRWENNWCPKRTDTNFSRGRSCRLVRQGARAGEAAGLDRPEPCGRRTIRSRRVRVCLRYELPFINEHAMISDIASRKTASFSSDDEKHSRHSLGDKSRPRFDRVKSNGPVERVNKI
jgi:hypothetical protein